MTDSLFEPGEPVYRYEERAFPNDSDYGREFMYRWDKALQQWVDLDYGRDEVNLEGN